MLLPTPSHCTHSFLSKNKMHFAPDSPDCLEANLYAQKKGRSPKPGPTKKSSVRLSTHTTIHIKRHYNPFLTPERYLYYSTSLAWKDHPGFKTKEPAGFALLLSPSFLKTPPSLPQAHLSEKLHPFYESKQREAEEMKSSKCRLSKRIQGRFWFVWI